MKTKKAHRPVSKVVTASISLDEALLQEAREVAKRKDTDFSKYVRGLIREDFKKSGQPVAA